MPGTDDWTGKTVLITGAAGGMGAAIAREFHAAGASLALVDIDNERLNILHTEFGGRSLPLIADIAKVDRCKFAVDSTLERFGRIDVLINAAGVWVEGPSDTMTEEQWDRTVDINLKATFFMCRYAIPALEHSEGQIINIASDAGLMGNAGAAIYCASKGGVVNLTRALALELAPKGTRVNAICPCDVDTPMLAYQANTFGGGDPEAYLAKLRSIYPQGTRTRFAAPEEIAHFIFMIASPALKPLTGAALSIDFGTTAGR